jgi:hypothetical protein
VTAQGSACLSAAAAFFLQITLPEGLLSISIILRLFGLKDINI